MSIVILDELKAQLNVTSSDDDALLTQKIASAQGQIERQLGFSIETEYPDETPPALREAVLQLAAWWYEQRETALAGMSANEIPYGVASIVQDYRNWSFGSDA